MDRKSIVSSLYWTALEPNQLICHSLFESKYHLDHNCYQFNENSGQLRREKAPEEAINNNWLPIVDSFRTDLFHLSPLFQF